MQIKELKSSHTIDYEFSLQGSPWMREDPKCRAANISIESRIIRFSFQCNNDYVSQYTLIPLGRKYCLIDDETDELLMLNLYSSSEDTAAILFETLDISEEISLLLVFTLRDLIQRYSYHVITGEELYVRS